MCVCVTGTLKGATIKGKNVFFPLKVSPMRIENNFKRHLIGKPQK